jgi:hypothetical protein
MKDDEKIGWQGISKAGKKAGDNKSIHLWLKSVFNSRHLVTPPETKSLLLRP